MAIRVGGPAAPPPPTAGGDQGGPERPAEAPASADQFKGQVQSFLALAQGKAPPKLVAQLMSDLSKLTSAREVPQRFSSDLTVAKPDLVEHPQLMREDKAQRLFDFAVPYVQKAAELKATPEVMNQLVQQAQAQGFAELRTGDKDGVQALRELTKEPAGKVADAAGTMKFDAPTWPQVPRPIVPMAEAEKQRNEKDDEPRSKGVLSRNTLWNVLHLFRDDGYEDRESAKQREEKSQLVLMAGLVLVFITIIVVVLATL
jgi:hypothetical protein